MNKKSNSIKNKIITVRQLPEIPPTLELVLLTSKLLIIQFKHVIEADVEVRPTNPDPPLITLLESVEVKVKSLMETSLFENPATLPPLPANAEMFIFWMKAVSTLNKSIPPKQNLY